MAICRLKMYMDVIRCELLSSHMLIEAYSYYPIKIYRVVVMEALDPTEWRVDSRGDFKL
jgi:hypothetical protein